LEQVQKEFYNQPFGLWKWLKSDGIINVFYYTVEKVYQMRLGVFAPRFYRASLDKFPLKICGIRRGFNFIQPGFEPPLNGIPIGFHLTSYRCGRLLLNEGKWIKGSFIQLISSLNINF